MRTHTAMFISGTAFVFLAATVVHAAHTSFVGDEWTNVGVSWVYTYVVRNGRGPAANITLFEVGRSKEAEVQDLWPLFGWTYNTPPLKFQWEQRPGGIGPNSEQTFIASSFNAPVVKPAMTFDAVGGGVAHSVWAPDPPLLDKVDVQAIYLPLGSGGYHYEYAIEQTQGDPVGVAFELDPGIYSTLSNIQVTGQSGWTADYYGEITVDALRPIPTPEQPELEESFEIAVDLNYLIVQNLGLVGLDADESLTLSFDSPYLLPDPIVVFSEGTLQAVTPVPEPGGLALMVLGAVGLLRGWRRTSRSMSTDS